MTTGINETHNPNLKSWVESANDPNTDFPIQNLPFVIFDDGDNEDDDGDGAGFVGTRVGDQVLNLHVLDEQGYFKIADLFFDLVDLDLLRVAAFDPRTRHRLRGAVSKLLAADSPELRDNPELKAGVLRPIDQVRLVSVGQPRNYTDFYASIHHATNVGSMFRPDNPLLPNYKHIPIGYHGRASSIVVSGTEIKRPQGQLPPPDDQPGAGPSFGPCKMFDYELEIGAFVGPGNNLGEPIPIAKAREHIFGLCLLNDWSARDIQKWEYQPLGPFLAKNFGTTISPYVVTLEALEPFRIPAEPRPPGDPRPLEYLYDQEDQRSGGFDITLEVLLQSAEMAKRGLSPIRLSRGNFKHMYWTFAQMLAHHTSNGCNLQSGDLIGSGTISGPAPESRGCLLELTWQGLGPDKKPLPRKPIELPSGEKRTFLADGDTVIFKGYCEREGFRRIGFGECRGTIKG